MNKDQAFQMIEEATKRVLADAEVDSLGEWARATLASEKPTPRSDGGIEHSVAEWITTFTKTTRPTPHFGENFKKVNRTVMPSVVALFEKKPERDLTPLTKQGVRDLDKK